MLPVFWISNTAPRPWRSISWVNLPRNNFQPGSQEQVFSAFWQQYPIRCNRDALTEDTLHRERTPDQNLPCRRLLTRTSSMPVRHWTGWLFPANTDCTLIVRSRGHHCFGPSESNCCQLHLEHQPRPADGGAERMYTIMTTVWALSNKGLDRNPLGILSLQSCLGICSYPVQKQCDERKIFEYLVIWISLFSLILTLRPIFKGLQWFSHSCLDNLPILMSTHLWP